MESFFVSVLSNKMTMEFSESRYIVGYDKRFNIDWESEFKNVFNVKNVDDFLVINSIIEVHVEKTQQDSTYISLYGCLSCFDEATNEMVKIIDEIQKIINDVPMVFVFGDIYPYNRSELISILMEKYSDKKKEFDLMYHHNSRVCPYQFYNKKNSIIEIIKGIGRNIKIKR